MINNTNILASFVTANDCLTAFKEENEFTLDTKWKTSQSGLYVNDLPGVSLLEISKSQNIKANLSPEFTPNTYINSIYNSEVLNMLNKFILVSKQRLETRELRQNECLNNSPAIKTIDQNAEFVGYLIELQDSNTLRMVINSISLQANKAQTVRIYLYELSKKTVVKTQDFIITSDYDRNYTTVSDWILQFKNSTSSGNKYLIGYYEHNANDPHINQLDSDSKALCSYLDYCKFEDFSKDAYITPIRIPYEYHNWNGTDYDCPDIVDVNSLKTGSSYIEGLSFFFSIEIDYTQLIIDSKLKFAELLQHFLARRIVADCLHTSTMNQITEMNRNKWKENILYFDNKINGYSFTDSYGNKGYYRGLIDNIIKDFQGIDKKAFKRNYNKAF